MTSAPSMDPSGLAAAIDASLKQRPVSDIIRAYLSAARSAPEAGKAVEALAEARECINRYADTAAEHDLVARIDALTGASE